MTYSQLLKIINRTELSAEQLAPAFGVSNMTIRRWREKPGSHEVPKAYERLLVEAVRQMVIDGRLSAEEPEVSELLAASSENSVQAALKGMGVSDGDLQSKGNQSDRLVRFLQCIGFSDRHRCNVDQSTERIAGFKKLGSDWKSVISVLTGVIRSRRISPVDKIVAYGALFYLLCPLDLIPDHIPIFGLTDDFAVLTVAAGFYLKRGSESSNESR